MTLDVELYGQGKVTFEVWANSAVIDTIEVDFAEEDELVKN